MRVFVSIEISNDEVINSIKNFQKLIKIDAKPTELKNLHFTLQFLGEVSEQIIDKIIQSLNTIKFSKFDISLKGIGVFPKLKSPKIIWIGTDEKSGKIMIELSKKVEKALEPLGFSTDKPFKPHITVFRIKKKIGDITEEMENHKNVNFGIQEITSIKLKKSELTLNGPVYSDLMEIKIK
ncbi:MAG: RNA 2',3'-cyclic phosphodiesterase [Nitrosopumilus sp.]|jgi:2'-5' RNA ligase